MLILVTPTFVRAVKKLHPAQKSILDQTISHIANHPDAGENKVGDLAGVRIFKFRMKTLLCLLAYRMLDESTIKLLMVGPHENFYRDLKRTDY
jgi:mRNA-degrading endonuclease RelE of RelBE toxin-antitoxin system